MVNFDGIGPEKILEVYNAKVGMHGFVVLDSLSLGPAKGGIRMTPDVDMDEVARLARTMTLKCSLAGLPFGGGKSGIIANPKELTEKKKKEIIEAFADALKEISPKLYVAAPDINTGEKEMAWYAKRNGNKSVTGKPKSLGGLPHELGSTGFGVYQATKVAVEYMNKKLKNMTFAVEGFGNVGWFVAKFLTKDGARLVAVSDSRGVLHNKNGIDFEKLAKIKQDKGSVIDYKQGEILKGQDILRVKADILITAAVPDLIKISDVDDLKFKLIVEGSNIPTTPEVEEYMHKKGILVVPDFVANAGGVISSYVEYIKGNEKKMFKMVEEKITRNTRIVLNIAKKQKIKPRDAAMRLAQERVLKKCKVCNVQI